MEGCCKFTGYSNIDEDPDNDNIIGIKNDSLFDFSLIDEWNKNKQLEITMTEKANGKFAIFKMFDNKIICGSKNYHILFDISDIDENINNNTNNKIMYNILIDIKKNLYLLTNLIEKFDEGYSLVGELCDGQHFTFGDNTISWFGFFKNGIPLETMVGLKYLSKKGIKTVNYSKVFDSNVDINLSSVFKSARCLHNEGYVFHCHNIKTNKVILVKVKAVGYIVKRITRQILLRGYKYIYDITKRFIETQEYHQLNTSASIRITNILIGFGMWMMTKNYPVSILGHMEIKSVRGELDNGFNKYWIEYLNETNSNNLDITEDDFGLFVKDEYLAQINIYNKRSYFNPVLVIFLQGLQGSGKSTIANNICNRLKNTKYLEQDMFWSDTLSCQGALYHNIADINGPDTIIVSRCNINEKQYNKYLEICFELPTRIIFISPDKMDNIDIMISLQGVINRSNKGDLMMVGRNELPIEQVVDFIVNNFNDYKINPLSYSITTRKNDNNLLKKIEFIKSNTDIIEYVKNNIVLLNSLRLSIDEIATSIIDIINNININKIIINPKPTFIGLFLSEEDKLDLTNFVNSKVIGTDFTIYNHHLTLSYKPINLSEQIQQFQHVKIEISKLVIRKSDRASAYFVKNIIINKKNIYIDNPHITSKIPSCEKPVISQSFVYLIDDSVEIIEYNKTINTICIWSK
jgi:adenylate kinase family enzyme